MTEKTEAELVAERVDTREWGPTESDEEAVLASLYGEPDKDGIYRGGDEE
ncbi:hypothetical protein ACFQVD_26390 [Streptosporangium amethystogenes subsp. fukuiense]|uniref:Uncharacterized protein n=1 Tax=Streptosporangium amethystogenes subsp. fukuiense TaxID=698418 RepID=A0ABW2T6G2_9ACTN